MRAPPKREGMRTTETDSDETNQHKISQEPCLKGRGKSGILERRQESKQRQQSYQRAERKQQTATDSKQHKSDNDDDERDAYDEWSAYLRKCTHNGGELVGVVNVTNLWTNFPRLSQMPCSVFAVSEAAIPTKLHPAFQQYAAKHGLTAVLTGTDPEQSKPGAGVALLARKPHQLRQLAMSTDQGKQAQQLGRLIKGAVQTTAGDTFNIQLAYGWSGSDADKDKAARTNAMIRAARMEEQSLCNTPGFFVGDLNASKATLTELTDAIATGEWIDIADFPALQEAWHTEVECKALIPQGQPTPNCWAHNAKKPSIRSYIIANRRAAQMLHSWATGPWAIFDVHAPIAIQLTRATSKPIRQLKKLDSLQPEDDEMWEGQGEPPQGKFTKKNWPTVLKAEMETQFRVAQSDLDTYLAAGDTTNYWYEWCRCVEEAHIAARQLPQEASRKMRGRGRVLFETTESMQKVTYLQDDEESLEQLSSKHVERPLTAARMLQQLKNLARKNESCEWTTEQKELCNAIKRKYGDCLSDEARQKSNHQCRDTSLSSPLTLRSRACTKNAGQKKREHKKETSRAQEKSTKGPKQKRKPIDSSGNQWQRRWSSCKPKRDRSQLIQKRWMKQP